MVLLLLLLAPLQVKYVSIVCHPQCFPNPVPRSTFLCNFSEILFIWHADRRVLFPLKFFGCRVPKQWEVES